MDEPLVTRYWCHMCSRMVNPVMEVEIKCPRCDSGFVEEMDGRGESNASNDVGSEQDMSLWAPVLFGMLGGGLRRRRAHQEEEDQEDSSDRDRELEALLRRRRRSSALLQLLQALREGSRTESDGSQGERERERVIFMNPFNQTIILQGSVDQNQNQTPSTNHGSTMGVSLGDYYVGPGLELLLQHLAENDPNQYGTPPAQLEAVDAMPTVKIDTDMSCSVYLEDFEIGAEAKEMPCKHKFHIDCILPWLELHSSCPVCRHQMPADESKVPSAGSNGSRPEAGTGSGGEGGNDRQQQRRLWIPVPWPFSFDGLISISGSQGSGDNSAASGSNPSNEN